MILQENMLFANRYNLIRLLGRGGFSEVWLAQDKYTKLQIAIKVYAPGQGMAADGLQEFCGELANVFDLNHTNLLKPTHVDTYDDMPYLIMAYCPNGSVANKISKLNEKEIWQLIYDVASGLAYLHSREVVHQDISPDNILIDEHGNYVITDFGISNRARTTLRKSVIKTSSDGGKMAYMGPERFSKQPAPTKASDIWSFGAMLYEIVEGTVPFGEIGGGLQKGGAEITEIQANISDTLKQTIEQMLAPDTWDRPTAEQLVQKAKRQLNGEPEPSNNTGDKKKKPEKKEPNKTVPITGTNNGSAVTDSSLEETVDPNKQSKKKRIVWILVALIVVIPVALGIIRYKEIQKEKAELSYSYSDLMSSFDTNLNNAGMDNIEVLNEAISNLRSMERIEANVYFEDPHRSAAKKEELTQKVQALYDEADRRYQLAPSGTEAEKRNLNKRRQLYEIKQNI